MIYQVPQNVVYLSSILSKLQMGKKKDQLGMRGERIMNSMRNCGYTRK